MADIDNTNHFALEDVNQNAFSNVEGWMGALMRNTAKEGERVRSVNIENVFKSIIGPLEGYEFQDAHRVVPLGLVQLPDAIDVGVHFKHRGKPQYIHCVLPYPGTDEEWRGGIEKELRQWIMVNAQGE